MHPMKASAFNESSSSSVLQNGNIADLDEGIKFCRDVVSLCSKGHPDCGVYLNNLAISLGLYHFNHQGNPNDLDKAISLHKVLHLRPLGHKFRNFSLDGLGLALVAHFNKCGAVDIQWLKKVSQCL
ncbi:uncharacterized protein F5891DRAFT_1192321 [Suillus fuscotomentosus]|uniref:Uncharacterized protein n=1 Tax=Suillus fuscotomentosus TaxID=1912939 RepID=A0AAD4E032_9AGAM|nr:uncharacterized protein F5891DRAFT_1192321 [Suillus fuscotomentosus]KAG1897142.1 hypothetical protein F5891DRAFT_1192321 [Suillus fuscotomentosus]